MNGNNIFTLDNTGLQRDYSIMAFELFETLLAENESGAGGFIVSIGHFIDFDFSELNQRVHSPDDTKIEMTEKQLILYYSVLHFICAAFEDKKEVECMHSYFEYYPGDLPVIKEKILKFWREVSEKLIKENPHLKDFNSAVQKISIDFSSAHRQ